MKNTLKIGFAETRALDENPALEGPVQNSTQARRKPTDGYPWAFTPRFALQFRKVTHPSHWEGLHH
jgi:hypothetical protein